MSITMLESVTPNVSRIRKMDASDLETADTVRSVFADYRKRGVIADCHFDEDIWKLSNQVENVTYSLSFENGGMAAAEWLGCDLRSYRDCVKSYVVLNLGTLQLSTMRILVRLFNRLSAMSVEEAASIVRDAHHALALLKLLPGVSEYRDLVIGSLEERCDQSYLKGKDRQQRTLAQFKSYLKFNEILTSFWETANREQKLFYFPVYFWWTLTAILPLRPTEFLLTPRGCLIGNMLTIRRTRLKGGMSQIRYRVADDYECHQYAITDRMAGEIDQYIRSTETLRPTELDTLLRIEPHFGYAGMSPSVRNRYFTYADLNSCLRRFYQETMNGAGAITEQIHLGDTRHLAMISLILSGGSPTICKDLAGHANIDISSHYYANIATFVECVTLERFRKSRGGSAELIGANRYSTAVPAYSHRVTDGNCDAMSVSCGDVRECLKIVNTDGQIGDCAVCSHFWPDDPGMQLRFRDSGVARETVDMDSQYLIRMIELVRRGLGGAEDIGSAILRLQHSCNRFAACLTEKYLKADDM